MKPKHEAHLLSMKGGGWDQKNAIQNAVRISRPRFAIMITSIIQFEILKRDVNSTVIFKYIYMYIRDQTMNPVVEKVKKKPINDDDDERTETEEFILIEGKNAKSSFSPISGRSVVVDDHDVCIYVCHQEVRWHNLRSTYYIPSFNPQPECPDLVFLPRGLGARVMAVVINTCNGKKVRPWNSS